MPDKFEEAWRIF